MYDTINFRLLQSEVSGVDFLSETPCYLTNVGEHNFDGQTVITGDLDGLKVSLNRYQMKLKGGSLCKWHLGSNFQTMSRRETKLAIEKLSDTLHLPLDKANVTRLDVAENIITKHPTDAYFNHLGLLKHSTRLQEPSGIYYKRASGRLCFYDKVKEQKTKKEAIPELYQNRNVLRYEQRYTNRIASRLKVNEVVGSTLYNEAFYTNILDRWKEDYKAIQKINNISLNFETMKTKQQLYKMGLLSLIQQVGGQLKMIEQINEAQQRGDITKKQAFDQRQAVNDACKIREGLTVKNRAIIELDKKVNDAIKFYR